MASLYRRPKSPFWWIKWRDPEQSRVIRESTRFRIGIGADLLAARRLRAELQVKEQSGATCRASGWDWVLPFLEAKYRARPGGRRPVTSWRGLRSFLEHAGIAHPHQLKRADCLAYPGWRTAGGSMKAVSHNTAILELRTLSVVIRESVRRGLCATNPCRDLGLRKVASPSRPELSDDDIARIRAAIAAKRSDPDTPGDVAHFLRVSFEIALAQGCRLSETCLDLHRDIDLGRMEITFHAKGDRFYTTELNPALVPLIEELRASGRRMSYDYGAHQPTMRSLRWHKFLRSLGYRAITFHSTRVTVISRMERAGAPEAVVMRVVGHASTTVHRVYRRFHKAELQAWWPKTGDGGSPKSCASPDSLASSPSPP